MLRVVRPRGCFVVTRSIFSGLRHQEDRMLKKLMIATAATALLAGGAYSQAPAPQSTSPAAMKAQFVEHQAADQMLASKFKGTDVLGPNNEKIGDVTDILFEKDQKVLAYVIGVGGFLGIGSKDVALAPASFPVQPATDKENMKPNPAKTKGA